MKSVNLPGTVPGARNSALSSLTLMISTPGTLNAALVSGQSVAVTMSALVACLYFRPRALPLPARTFRFSARARSLVSPIFSNACKTSLVFWSCSNSLVIMKG